MNYNPALSPKRIRVQSVSENFFYNAAYDTHGGIESGRKRKSRHPTKLVIENVKSFVLENSPKVIKQENNKGSNELKIANSYEDEEKRINVTNSFAEMKQSFQQWVLQTYKDTSKTKTVTATKYERIVKTLKGEIRNCAENSKFRFWMKCKGFRLGLPPTPFIQEDRNIQNNTLLFVVDKKDGIIKYKRVAVVEDFFDIIYNMHINKGVRSIKHAGQKRTHRSITETFAFLPREAVTKFLSGCPECQKKNSPTIKYKKESKFVAKSENVKSNEPLTATAKSVSISKINQNDACSDWDVVTNYNFSKLMNIGTGNGHKYPLQISERDCDDRNNVNNDTNNNNNNHNGIIDQEKIFSQKLCTKLNTLNKIKSRNYRIIRNFQENLLIKNESNDSRNCIFEINEVLDNYKNHCRENKCNNVKMELENRSQNISKNFSSEIYQNNNTRRRKSEITRKIVRCSKSPIIISSNIANINNCCKQEYCYLGNSNSENDTALDLSPTERKNSEKSQRDEQFDEDYIFYQNSCLNSSNGNCNLNSIETPKFSNWLYKQFLKSQSNTRSHLQNSKLMISHGIQQL